ncbi:flagellar basal body P-ring formation chaperone FlgA [Bordetella avium]|uniref:flagellar basal body P-ring formation chaperone FlgA n=1 Tax=Bordetella avium TaxID=521 RepID=UPI000E0B2EB7|nr:flagellar basal body P-ring formation chaperone FlgA [Bordetella avium]RIQ11521.1 flagellar basal body P-ring formation protein FlgA [Bordetella avium]RIQ34914.1 flagellar basal body P-ring formation protein FlgA [Bordetella avium]RIQ38244.1 flagellar basal body P-ring formation protein FlgA [Bordetella avium]RIQ39268.1 flagellar basal body P-ring formation protein FlgA [Bordetella avium]RIQ44898.1 flagellar basal body P-ring formation protein FlgA [Bordetella avium]
MQFPYWQKERSFYNLHTMRFVHTLALLLCTLFGLPAGAARAQATETPEHISRAAEDFLRAQVAPLSSQATITMDPVKNDRLPACDALVPFMPAAARLRPRVIVGVRCSAPQNWTVYVQANLNVPGIYYVASRQIPAGQAITSEDLDSREGDLMNLPPGAMTDARSIVGMQARHRINIGQPIRGSALRDAASISRGQNVRIIARGNGFVVSSEGQALEDGAPGATIQVRTQSGQVVSGVLQPGGQVELQL